MASWWSPHLGLTLRANLVRPGKQIIKSWSDFRTVSGDPVCPRRADGPQVHVVHKLHLHLRGAHSAGVSKNLSRYRDWGEQVWLDKGWVTSMLWRRSLTPLSRLTRGADLAPPPCSARVAWPGVTPRAVQWAGTRGCVQAEDSGTGQPPRMSHSRWEDILFVIL